MDELRKYGFDWSTYTGNLHWLPDRTILLVKSGSQSYGTSLPTSDLDVKGVAVPPREYFHGFLKVFEQAEQTKPDLVVYDIRKFFRLAADCNPNIVEVMWTDPNDWLQMTEPGLMLVNARALFLSRKAKHTFSGYAAAQLKRIRGHNRRLRNPPTAPPVRADFGLPESSVISSDDRDAAEAAIQKKIDEWGLDLESLTRPEKIALEGKIAATLAEMQIGADEQWCAASRVLGFSENFIEAMKNERRYRTVQREWAQFQDWKKNRNPERAAMEAQFGMDCKHAMHLVRLTKMCREILTTSKVIVKRPDAEELLSIRNGAWTYEQLVEWAEREDAELEEVAKTSLLPHAPDRAKLDQLCQTIVESVI